MTTFLYFIAETDGPVKIGIAVDPVKRLSGLQIGNPRQLALLTAYEIPEDVDPGVFERAIHRTFSGFRIRGEWFENNGVVSSMMQQMTDLGPAWMEHWEAWAGQPFVPRSCPASS